MTLRFWFLLPARILLALLLAAPLAIICVYSALTRGAYGGVSLPATAENCARFFDPLYAAILWRSLLMAAAATALCLLLGFPLALYELQLPILEGPEFYMQNIQLWIDRLTGGS